ncbi:MAG: hypothetical protein RIS94_1400 [Pseudomonadota bacterium]
MGSMLLAMLALLNGCGLGSDTSGAVPMVTLGMAAPSTPIPVTPAATTSASSTTWALASAGPPMQLGAQTHFSQGWPLSTLSLADQAGAPTLRDALPWSVGEPVRGTYAFSGAAAQALDAACSSGKRLILTIVPTNPAYDGGLWVWSAEGRTAYAAYLDALVTKFGTCLAGIEMGNEINGANVLKYPAGTDAPTAYVQMAQAVRARIGGRTAILAASTNMIGTGFLKPYFAAGLLQQVDALTVHPYRLRGEGLDVELAHLDAVMDSYGRRVPVWATEFSVDTSDRAYAAGELVKQATLMAAAGVPQASWYALIDQRYFPNMGLFAGTTPKDQAKAFALMQPILALGRPRRIDMGDPLVFAWRFGADTSVIWGAPRPLTITGGSVVDPTGLPIGGTTVAERPLIVRGTTAIGAGPSNWVADTLMGWGSPQWRYFARTGAATDTALELWDDTYTSYFGGKWFKPLRINATSAAVAGTGSSPTRAVWRYIAPTAQSLDLRGCFMKANSGDGVDLTVTKNGKVLWSAILTTSQTPGPIALDLAAGDKVDLVAGPNQTFGGDAFNYRAVLFRRGTSTAVSCPG